MLRLPPLFCEFCTKETKELITHHLIPRWLVEGGEEPIKVCRSCHPKLEYRFTNFIKFGQFSSNIKKSYLKEYSKKYRKKYTKSKFLQYVKLEKYIYLEIIIRYNIRTNNYYLNSIYYFRRKLFRLNALPNTITRC